MGNCYNGKRVWHKNWLKKTLDNINNLFNKSYVTFYSLWKITHKNGFKQEYNI